MAKKTKAPTTEVETVETVKGFDTNLQCRGFQFEVGKTYRVEGDVVVCNNGFHAVEMPMDAWSYYGPATSRFGVTQQAGQLARHDQDSKIASAEITIKAEISLPDLVKRAVAWVLDRAKGNTATGYRGHAAATGYRGHAAATGYRGHAAATGNRGHAAATGDSGHAAATGYRGHAAATGDSGHAAVKGKHAIAAAIGIAGTAQAEAGGAISLAAYDDDYNLVCVRSSMVWQNGVEPGKRYRLTVNGDFEQVEEA